MHINVCTSEIIVQLQNIVRYYIATEDFKKEFHMLGDGEFNPDENVDNYANMFEIETDAFINKLASLLNSDRTNTLKYVDSTSKDVIRTFIIRLTIMHELLEKKQNQKLTVSDENDKFLIDCTINYWKKYKLTGFI